MNDDAPHRHVAYGGRPSGRRSRSHWPRWPGASRSTTAWRRSSGVACGTSARSIRTRTRCPAPENSVAFAAGNFPAADGEVNIGAAGGREHPALHPVRPGCPRSRWIPAIQG